MRVQACWSVGALMAFLWASPANAQNVSEALKLVPEDAPAFALINRVGKTLDWFDKLTKKQNFPVSFREMLRNDLGFDKGLDEKGDVVLVIYLGPDGEQINVYGLPITDYKDFLQGLKPGEAKEGVREITLANGEKMLAANRGKYALLAKPERAASLKKVLAGGKNVVAATGPLHRWLAETSYSLVLTPRGLQKAQADLRKKLDTLQRNPPVEVAQFVLPLLDGVGQFLKSDEITYLSVGAQLGPAGDVAFRFKSLFKEGGAFAESAGQVKPLADGPLAGLAAGPYALAGGGPIPSDFMKALIGLKVQLIKVNAANLDQVKIRELEKASLELARNVQGLSLRLGRSKEGEPLARALTGVLRVPDASTFLTDAENELKTIATVLKDLKSSLVSDLAVRQVRFGQYAALEITVHLGQGLAPAQNKLIEALFGAEGKISTTMLAVGDSKILVGYCSAAELVKRLPRDTDRGLADDQQTMTTIKLLPKDAQWVLLMHPQGLIDLISRFEKNVGAMRFPDAPPLGIALHLSSAGADLEMVMPAALVEASMPSPPKEKKR